MRNDVINMSGAWDKENIRVPDRNWTYDLNPVHGSDALSTEPQRIGGKLDHIQGSCMYTYDVHPVYC